MFAAAVVNCCIAAHGAAALAIVLGALPVASPHATSPDRTWIGVKKILILSRLEAGIRPASTLTADALCQRVEMLASAGARMPVSCSRLGDPHLADADTAVLVVDAAITQAEGANNILLFTIRRQNIGGLEPGPAYFGAAPRAVPFSTEIDPEELDAALRASLGQILPWFDRSIIKLEVEDK